MKKLRLQDKPIVITLPNKREPIARIKQSAEIIYLGTYDVYVD